MRSLFPRLTSHASLVMLAGLAGLALSPLPASGAETLIPVPPVPGSTTTGVFGINDNNIVAGTYTTADGVEHGFFGGLDGDYTTFDVPDSYGTEPRGINDSGMIMGVAYDADGNSLPFERYADGSISYVTLKHGAPMTLGHDGGINANGVFVAMGLDQNGKSYRFYGENAKYTKRITLSNGKQPFPRGIDDAGDVVGYYYQQKTDHGFLQQGGVTTTVDYPDARAVATKLSGINNSGLVAGIWQDEKARTYAFTYDSTTDTFTPLAEKGVKHGRLGQAFGLNNAGLVAVNFYAADGPFIYCPHKPSQCPSGGASARLGGSGSLAVPAKGVRVEP